MADVTPMEALIERTRDRLVTAYWSLGPDVDGKSAHHAEIERVLRDFLDAALCAEPVSPQEWQPINYERLAEELIALYGACLSQSADPAVHRGAHPGEDCSRSFVQSLKAACN